MISPIAPGLYHCVFSVAPHLVQLWWDGECWRWGVARVRVDNMLYFTR